MRDAIIRSCFFLLMVSLFNCGGGEKIVRVFGHIAEDPARKISDINYIEDAASNKPRFAILSHYTTDEENLGFIDLATKNHQKYARLHNYDYFFRNGTITKKYFDPKGKNRTFQLGLYWQKIEATRELLAMKKNGKNVYDYVLWIDADAIFTNIFLSLEEIINRAPKDAFFIVADDPSALARNIHHSCINTGVYIIKNSSQGRNFIDTVDKSFEIYKSLDWPEQLAMGDVAYGFINEKIINDLKENPSKIAAFSGQVKWRNCAEKPAVGTHIFYMRDINAAYAWVGDERIRWDENSLVAHFLGLSGPKVEKYARVLLACLEQTDYRNRKRCNPYDLNITLR